MGLAFNTRPIQLVLFNRSHLNLSNGMNRWSQILAFRAKTSSICLQLYESPNKCWDIYHIPFGRTRLNLSNGVFGICQNPTLGPWWISRDTITFEFLNLTMVWDQPFNSPLHRWGIGVVGLRGIDLPLQQAMWDGFLKWVRIRAYQWGQEGELLW